MIARELDTAARLRPHAAMYLARCVVAMRPDDEYMQIRRCGTAGVREVITELLTAFGCNEVDELRARIHARALDVESDERWAQWIDRIAARARARGSSAGRLSATDRMTGRRIRASRRSL